MNRNRLYSSAMGSPKTDAEIERGSTQREAWLQSVLSMWIDNKVSYHQAFSKEWFQKALDLIEGSFSWSEHSLEELFWGRYFDAMDGNIPAMQVTV